MANHGNLSFSFPARKIVIDQSPQPRWTPIEKTNCSSKPIGFVFCVVDCIWCVGILWSFNVNNTTQFLFKNYLNSWQEIQRSPDHVATELGFSEVPLRGRFLGEVPLRGKKSRRGTSERTFSEVPLRDSYTVDRRVLSETDLGEVGFQRYLWQIFSEISLTARLRAISDNLFQSYLWQPLSELALTHRLRGPSDNPSQS